MTLIISKNLMNNTNKNRINIKHNHKNKNIILTFILCLNIILFNQYNVTAGSINRSNRNVSDHKIQSIQSDVSLTSSSSPIFYTQSSTQKQKANQNNKNNNNEKLLKSSDDILNSGNKKLSNNNNNNNNDNNKELPIISPSSPSKASKNGSSGSGAISAASSSSSTGGTGMGAGKLDHTFAGFGNYGNINGGSDEFEDENYDEDDNDDDELFENSHHYSDKTLDATDYKSNEYEEKHFGPILDTFGTKFDGQDSDSSLPIFLIEPQSTYVVKNRPAILKCKAAHTLQLSFKCSGSSQPPPSSHESHVDPHTGVPLEEVTATISRDLVDEYFGKGPFKCECHAWSSRGGAKSQLATVEVACIKKKGRSWSI